MYVITPGVRHMTADKTQTSGKQDVKRGRLLYLSRPHNRSKLPTVFTLLMYFIKYSFHFYISLIELDAEAINISLAFNNLDNFFYNISVP